MEQEVRIELYLFFARCGHIDFASAAENSVCGTFLCRNHGRALAFHCAIDHGYRRPAFRIKYLSTLFGIVFLSHQVGSFMGVWLGGLIYDKTGSYDGMWWAGIVLGILAGLIHLPINERPVTRLNLKPAV